jgi:hypothetical protein
MTESEYARQYYLRNREKILARCKAWRENNRERANANCKAYRARHKDKVNARYLKKQLRTLYGLTLEEFNLMTARQNGVCAICGKPPAISKKKLHVDHCHRTGKIRKLLCHKCNMGLGAFLDDPEVLRAAASYIEAHPS